MTQPDLKQLLSRARWMPKGWPQIEAFEKVIREADALGEEEIAFAARKDLMQVAELSGNGDRVLVAFSWCLAKADASDKFDETDLLWQYKWAIFNALQFFQVDRQQLEAMLDDFAERLRRNGYSPRPATYLGMQYDYMTGRLDDARQRLDQWKKQPRDQFADCKACELDNTVELHFYLRQDKRALELAEPLIGGSMSCAEVPERTFATLVVCGLRSGWRMRTAQFFKRGYKRTARDLDFLRQTGMLALYLARRRKKAAGLELLEQHLPLAMRARVPRDRLDFFTGAAAVARSLGTAELPLRLPSEHPLHRPGKVPAPELARWLEEQVEELCLQFDERNGNAWQSELAAHLRELSRT